MRRFSIVLLLIIPAQPALAQSYDAQPGYAPPAGYSQQQISGNYYAAPYPPIAQPAYPTPLEQAPQAPANQPRPSDYGQSVMTDIRQMNF